MVGLVVTLGRAGAGQECKDVAIPAEITQSDEVSREVTIYVAEDNFLARP